MNEQITSDNEKSVYSTRVGEKVAASNPEGSKAYDASSAASYLREHAEMILADLWFDLANRDVLDLYFEYNVDEHDRFGPIASSVSTEEGWDSPVLKIFSPRGYALQGLRLDAVVEIEKWEKTVIRETARSFSVLGGVTANDGPDLFVYGKVHQYFTLTEEGNEGYEEYLENYMVHEFEEYMSFKATPIEDPRDIEPEPLFEGLRYDEIDRAAQLNFAWILTGASEDPEIQKLRIAEHIGKLLLLHPNSSPEAKHALLSSTILNPGEN